MIQLILLLSVLGTNSRAPQPPQLSEPQLAEIRKLIRDTKNLDGRIKGRLVKQQQELTAAYSDFELDEKRIERLQKDIVDLQKQLLNNYHRLQTGLRRIAGRERFKMIKSRVDRYLRSQSAGDEDKSTGKGNQR